MDFASLTSIAAQQYVQSRLDALGRPDLNLGVSRGASSLEIRYGGHYSWLTLSYKATAEHVDALVAQCAAMPVYVEPKPAPARSSRGGYSKARRYDRLYNEGGEGYNPYR